MDNLKQTGRLRLMFNPVCPSADMNCLVARVRQLPAVVCVETDQERHQVEIVFRQPSDGFLRSIHAALQPASDETTPGFTRADA